MNVLDGAFGPAPYEWGALLVRLGAALLCGGLIGLDRELSERAAGLKTHMLVAVAAAGFTIAAMEMVAHPELRDPAIRLDLIRTVEAVTAGVAFLAAGAIFRTGHRVRNLTTGAGLWTAGAVGLACGLGFWRLAVAMTALALVVFVVIGSLERWLERLQKMPGSERS